MEQLDKIAKVNENIKIDIRIKEKNKIIKGYLWKRNK